jgi:hypothetical protein
MVTKSIGKGFLPTKIPDSIELRFHHIARMGRTIVSVEGRYTPFENGPSISTKSLRRLLAFAPERVSRFDQSVIVRTIETLRNWDGRFTAVTLHAELEVGLEVLKDEWAVARILGRLEQSQLRPSSNVEPFPRIVLVLGEHCLNFWHHAKVVTNLARLKEAGVGVAVSYLPNRKDVAALTVWLRQSCSWQYLKLDATFTKQVVAANPAALHQLEVYLDWVEEIGAGLILTGVEDFVQLIELDVQVAACSGSKLAFQGQYAGGQYDQRGYLKVVEWMERMRLLEQHLNQKRALRA